MAVTPNRGITYVPAGTLDPAAGLNDALRQIDAQIMAIVKSMSLTAPPGSPVDGDQYIVGASATGAWSGKDKQLAQYVSTGAFWQFYTAASVGVVLNKADGGLYAWDFTSAWGPAAPGATSLTQGKFAIYIPASQMRPSVSGGCAALAGIASAASQPDIVSLDFDTTTQEFAQFSLVMPKKWNLGTVSFRPHWSHAATTVNFGVVWSLQALARGDNSAIATNFGTAQTVVDTGGTTNNLYIGAESSAITVAGTPAAENMVFFRVARVPADGSDTMAIDARLHGVTLYITTNANTDA